MLIFNIATGINFPPLNIEIREQSLKLLNDGTEGLRQLAPHMGAYVNEVCNFSVTLPALLIVAE